MKRIDEAAAAKAFIAKLSSGDYPLERAKNCAVNYSEEKEDRDTQAVKEFTKSALFLEFKKMGGKGDRNGLQRERTGTHPLSNGEV